MAICELCESIRRNVILHSIFLGFFFLKSRLSSFVRSKYVKSIPKKPSSHKSFFNNIKWGVKRELKLVFKTSIDFMHIRYLLFRVWAPLTFKYKYNLSNWYQKHRFMLIKTRNSVRTFQKSEWTFGPALIEIKNSYFTHFIINLLPSLAWKCMKTTRNGSIVVYQIWLKF